MARHTLHLAFVLCSAAALALSTAASADIPPRRTSFPLEGSTLKLPAPITFETGSDKLMSTSNATLEYVAEYLDAKRDVTLLRIEAHSDGQGNPQKEQSLTEQRALSVARALIGRGIDCKRLIPVGFGATKPVADGATPEGRSRNRRVELVNAALRGRPIGGLPADGGGKVAGDPCK